MAEKLDIASGLIQVKRSIFVFFVLFFLPNILFFVISSTFGIGRPLVNFDYVIVSLFFIFGLNWLGVAFLALVYVFDVVFLVGQLFPFLRVSDLLYFVGLIGSSPSYYKVMFLVVLVQLFVFCAFFLRLKKRVPELAFINLALILYVFNFSYFDDSESKYYRYSSERFFDSVLVFSFDHRRTGFLESFDLESKPLVKASYKGATSPWFSSPMELSDKTILIVSESWGVSSDEIMDSVLSPIYELGDHIVSIERGELGFSGATVDGELRELCQLSSANFNLKDLVTGFEDCLPNRLRAMGYETYSLHGAVGSMYDRAYWYPRAGFDHRTFYETKQWSEKCHSFPGACDRELISELTKVFSETEKAFFYWLTLNSHSIYDRRDIYKDVFNCESFQVKEDGQVCRNLKLHAQFFYYLSTILDDPELEGAEVIIVGDHVPPIFDVNEKAKYFKSNSVPWIRFRVANPRNG